MIYKDFTVKPDTHFGYQLILRNCVLFLYVFNPSVTLGNRRLQLEGGVIETLPYNFALVLYCERNGGQEVATPIY